MFISGGPTAQIIERKGWKCDKDFVGHRKAVNCVVSIHIMVVRAQLVSVHTCIILATPFECDAIFDAIFRSY